jgi:hypothetical protein
MDETQRNALRAELGRLPLVRADGSRLLILRPKNPGVCTALAKEALRLQDVKLLRSIPEAAGECTFVGFCARGPMKYRDRPFAVDHEGNVVDEAEPGDIVVEEKYCQLSRPN